MTKRKLQEKPNRKTGQKKPAPKEKAAGDFSALSRRLLDWYGKNRRVLPWREDPAPYHVWVSEIMLQQTRVEAVKGYYERFLAAFPTVRDLAKAEEDEYLKLWEGLGYYSRVRNLHRAAVVLEEDYGGELPATAAELLKLPGIGRYTAAAISSIAFGEKEPAIDGNLLRVFSRLTCYEENILAGPAGKAAEEYYLTLMEEIPRKYRTGKGISSSKGADFVYGRFNQALMDLGAMVCLPNTMPLCGACPLEGYCLANKQGRQMSLPNRPAKQKRTIEKMTLFLIRFKDGVILRKRPDTGLLAGLYEFPHASGTLTQKEALRFAADLGFGPMRIKKLPPAKHIFSHKEWHMTAYEVFADEWGDFSRRAPEKAPASSTEDGRLFISDIPALENVWSIPSAFGFYRDYLLGK